MSPRLNYGWLGMMDTKLLEQVISFNKHFLKFLVTFLTIFHCNTSELNSTGGLTKVMFINFAKQSNRGKFVQE